MLTNDYLLSTDNHSAATTRRRPLHMAARVAANRTPGRAHHWGYRTGVAGDSSHWPSPRPEGGPGAPVRGDPSTDWYLAALRQLAGHGISTKVVALLPEPTAPAIDGTVAAIAKAVGDNPHEIAQTILIGHSVGSRALLAYLSRQGAHRSFAGLVSVAGWFTVDDLSSYPALAAWVNMDLNFGSIASAAGPITVHLSDNDPFTADWRTNAADWLGKLGATVHIAHGAGHYMTTSPGPIFDTIRVASPANT